MMKSWLMDSWWQQYKLEDTLTSCICKEPQMIQHYALREALDAIWIALMKSVCLDVQDYCVQTCFHS